MNIENPTNEEKDTLRSFLKEEIQSVRERLISLKANIKQNDFNSLDAELNEKSETLNSLKDEDDSQLFILRREIGLLRESVEARAVKRRWWSRLPPYALVGMITLPVILYFAWLSFVQWRNQGQIYNYPATQTAVATQATLPGPTAMPTSTPTQIP
jgi:hypothetical protein